ncbi:putative protein phosphatase 2C 47 [Citrus sinensis]|nr:putative protein phosphatase 2C 47 [Citrus sinensis]
MAHGTDVSVPPQQMARLDGKCCNGNMPMNAMEDQNVETLDNSNQFNNTAGKPPRNLSVMRHSCSSAWLSEAEQDLGIMNLKPPSANDSEFQPVFRSGSCSERGPKQYMEDEFICVDNLDEHLPSVSKLSTSGAFYGVFDGHGDAKSLDSSSGTTALTALILGRTMLIANAGDSRAVLGKRGRAIELSKDHKPNVTSERLRIEKLGGVIYDGYLNGQLAVARALGDWHIKGSKGSSCPLSSEPELEELVLTEEDEYLILGCDGLWDVMSSQCAVTMVRKELMQHNDPERCSKALVKEALQRNTCDNLTVVVVCFSPNPPPKIQIPKSHKRRSISAEGLDHLKGVLNGL